MTMTGSNTLVLPILVLAGCLLQSSYAQVPTVAVTQSSYSVNTGGTITLGCSVSSSSQVTAVFWQRNVNGFVTTINQNTNTNKYSGSTTSVPSLTIFNSASTDVGVYTCFATNGFGTGTSGTTSLSVTSSSVPTLSVQQTSYSVNAGTTVTLQCSIASTATTVTSVTWQRTIGSSVTTITSTTNTNKYSGSTTNQPSLTIFSTNSGDTGSYVCRATNSAGTGSSQTISLSVTTTTVPTLSVQQTSYSVNAGTTVTLQCSIASTATTVTSVTWQRTIGSSVTTITSTTNTNKYSGSTTNQPSLTIFSTNSGDTGSYVCRATNSAGTGSSQTISLSVTTSNVPTITLPTLAYNVVQGGTITLECTVSSTLTVTSVRWQRNTLGAITSITSTTNTNKYSGSTPSTPSLTITSATLTDAGDYTCFATNSGGGEGQSTESTTLTVLAPSPPTVNIQQPSYSVNTGGSVTLVCTVSSPNQAVTSVTWQRNVNGVVTTITSNTNTNKYSGSTTSTPSLTIFNAAQSDAGTYTCFATNNVGTGQSSATTLSVTGTIPTVIIQQNAYSVTTGNSITLVCTVTSSLPLTGVQWQRNVNGVVTTITSNTNTNKYSGSTTTTPSLTIFNAAQSDAGTYICSASNSVGTGTSTVTTLSVTGTIPTVIIQQNAYSVTTGNSITLVCTVTSSLALTGVQWQRNVNGVVTTITSNTNTNKYSGSTTSTPSLTIFNAAQSDAGTYICSASNSVGTGTSTVTTLSVTGNAPTVNIQQPSYSVTTGQSITLVCTVTSNLPITNVQWQRNIGGSTTTITSNTNTNKYSGSTTTTPSLTIFNAAQSDAGTYTCSASNSVGTGTSTTTTLSVTGNVPTVTVQQPSYSVTTGNSVTLVCSVSSNLPISSVYWQRNIGGSITQISSTFNTNKYSGSTTTIPSLTIFSAASSDVGTYQCFATNSVGTGQSTTTTLSVTGNPPTVAVQQPSYSVTTGNSLTLVCTVSSNLPITNVYWQRNIGGSITQISSTFNTNKYSGSTTTIPSLTIFSASSSDAGSYQCFATNSVGTGQSSFTTLSVSGTLPTVQIGQSSYSVIIGDSITLVCTVTSNLPVTSAQWERNIGGTITTITSTTDTNKYTGSTATSPSLTISNAALSDTGTYTCFATNSLGTGQSVASTLTVTGNPPTVTVQQPSYSVITGNSVTLVCSVSSNLPISSVYWQRNIGGSITQISSTTNTNKYSGSTTSTPSLTIFSAASSDVGTYQCFATNSVGTGQSTTTTLSVQGNPPTVTIQQPSYSVTTGQSITLVCSVSSSLPITNVQWQRNVGGSITTITSNTNTNKYSGSTTTTPSLTIFNAGQSDAGTYTCSASNSVGTGTSTTTTLSVTGNPPTVTIQQPSYSVTTGQSITLVCSVSSSLPITNVQWQRNINGVVTTITSSTNTNKYSGSTTTTPSLTIFNAAQSDAGTYTCSASNSVGTGTSTTTTLSVTGNPPTVTIQQPSYSVTTGQSITLVCTVTSNLPITNVQWQRNVGGSITTITSNTNTNKYSGSTTTTPSLTIFNAGQSDAGTYTCSASNSVGTGTSTTTTLSVTGNPPTVTIQQPSYSVTTGQSITLVCTVSSSLPITNVQWQRNVGGSITTITSNTNTNKYSGSTTSTPSLTIFNAAQSDVGTYTCSASNSVGTGTSSTTTLSVTGNPPTVVIQQPSYSVTTGQSITLVCTVTSNLPITNVQWQRNVGGTTTTITSNTNTNKYSGSTTTTPSLTIFNAAQSDVGTYTCSASNSVGTGTSTTTTLSVTGNPPTVTIQQPSYSVTTGQSITLVCTVTSNLPITNVQWQRNVGGTTTTITSNTNTNKYSGSTTTTPSLTIFNAAQSDVGTYTCSASNSVGTGTSTTTTLSVTGNPPTVTIQQPAYSVVVGNSVTLVCSVTSNLPVTNVQWQRNINGVVTTITSNTNTNKYSGSTTSTPSLTIFNAAQSDAGTYTCSASNSVGTGTSTTTTLSVTENPPTVTIQQPSYSVTTGQSITLVCTVTSNLPITKVQWQRNVGGTTTTITSNTNTNKYSGSTTTTPSLTIFNAAQSDVGTYTCSASNSVGTGTSTTTTLSVSGTPPTVQIQQPSYSTTIGDSITLVCTVTSNLPVTNVRWERNIGGTITTITSTTDENKYTGSTSTTPSLTISSAALGDSGVYRCFASNSVGTGQSTATTLTVTGTPPTVQIQQPSYSVTIGDSITLVCTVTSNLPVTNVRWERNIGGTITPITSTTDENKYTGSTVATPSLTIANAALGDTGTYTCFASNSVGTGQSSITTLTVTGTPPTVKVDQSSYSTTIGDSITLVCTVTSNLPVTSVQWERNIGGTVIIIMSTTDTNKYGGSTVSTPSLTISNAALSDSAEYTCFATNSVGTGESEATTLTVTGTPPNVQIEQSSYTTTVGDSITLTCTVTSNLTVTSVQWERNIGGTITAITSTTDTNKYTGSTATTPSLTIANAVVGDTGNYTCFATNRVRTGESEATTLEVTGNPPTVVIQQPSYSVITSQSVTLVCTVTSNLPIISVQWQRNIGGVITTITSNTNTNKYSGSTTSTPSLTIFNAAQSDAGTYTCSASNSVGTGTSTTTTLSVSGTPPVVTIQQPSYSANFGSTLTLVCFVTSNLAITNVYWQRNIGGSVTTISANTNSGKYSGSTSSIPSLTVFNVGFSDAGSYQCFASNSVGTGSSSTTQLNIAGNIPVVTILQPSYSVIIGNSVTLECTVSATPTHTSVLWQRIQNGVTTNINTGITNKYSGSTVNTPSLTIFNADQSDTGNYVCSATNTVGTGNSQQTTLSVTGNVPSVTILQPSYSVNLGGTVLLECTVSASPAHTVVQWQRIQNGVTTPISVTSSKYSGSTVQSPSLSINNADLNDNGAYICTATNVVGTGTSSQTTLTVTGNPPNVVIQQAQYSVLLGNTVTLVCTVTSNPLHTSVTWQRTSSGVTTTINVGNNNNKYSGSTVNVPSLTIFNSAESDEGNYICSAVNQFGQGTSQATVLTVTGSIPVVQVLQSTYNVNYGNSITLECTVTANPAHTSVLWRKLVNNQFQDIQFANNKYLGSSVSSPSLTVNSADLNDEGFYICTATNSIGTGQSSQTFLDVIGNILTVTIQQPQYSVLIGGTITLGCTVTGSPSANTVYWQKTQNGVSSTITSTTNTNKFSGSTTSVPSLTISGADLNDEATYVCFATNAVGTASSSQTFLDVTGNIPSVQVLQPQYSVNFGASITLECTVTANPSHTSVSWLRVINGQTSSINFGLNKYSGSTVGTPSLTINSAATNDEGNYICTATNSIGTGQSSQTFLDVVGDTLSVQIVQSTYSALLGTTVTLQCLVSGSPSATNVYWQKIQNGVTTTINFNTNTNKYSGSSVSTPSLTISNVEQSDEANYVCFGTNAVGTANSQQTFLDVTGNIPSVVIQQPQYTVLIGSSVTLVCTVTANPAHTTVYWRRIVNGALTDITVTNNNKYSGSTVSTPSLTISNAQNNDEGNYICYAENSVGTGQSSQTFLDVFGSIPVVTVANPSYSVNLGSTVTLDCTVSANPTETDVYWRKTVNGVTTTITSTSNTNKYGGSTVQSPSLQIFSTNLNDEATYRCYASNSVGTGESQATVLNVIGNIPVVTILQNQYSVNFGSSRTLECTVSATPTHTSVEWRRTVNGVQTTISVTNNNKYSGSTVNTPSLTVNNADNSDEGFYTCFASNSIGTGQSQQTYLDVVGNVPTVQVLSNNYNVILTNTITLECVVTATPQHTSVQWNRIVNGQTVNINMANSNKYSGSTVNSPSLTISSADNSDEGYYTCTATNVAGTGSSQQTYLDVTGSIPTVTVTLPTYNTNIGTTITLGCVVTSNPTHTTVYWRRISGNGAETNIDINSAKYSGSTVNSPSLTISNVVLGDEGNYRCYASNSIGTGQSQNTFLDVVGNIPIVTIGSNQYSTNIGSSITLECTVTSSPAHTTVYWQRNINGVTSTLQLNTGKYSGSTVSNPSLTINNADNSDEGFYICFATNSVGTGQSANTYLDVIGAIPIVAIVQPSYSVNFGGTVTLVCTVTANPAHNTVYWQKVVNGVATTVTVGNRYSGSTVNTPSLTITNAVQSDEGFYVCYATNSVGTGNSQQTFLDVAGNIPTVQVLSNTYSVNVANSVTLECTVTANPAHTSVSWLRVVNGQTTPINMGNTGKYTGSTVGTPSLTVFSAEQADEGYYICTATNSVGTGQSAQTYLDVVGAILSVVVAQPQYNVNYGNSITLVCTVSGTPAANSVYWQKLRNGQTTTITTNSNNNKYGGSTVQNPSLTITNAVDSDAATYTCFATNSIGTGSSQTTVLSVTGNLPTATIPSNVYTVTVGGSITIPCSVSGNPAVTSVQWTRLVNGQSDNIVISSNSRYSGGSVNSPSLVIANVVNADEGYYTCSATNLVGTGNSQQTFLDISGSVPIVNIPQSQYSVTVGNSVTLTCTVTSNPTHTSVRWVKTLNNINTDIIIANNNKYSGGSVNTPSLTISNSESSDSGYYTCYASNGIGEGQSQNTFLNVIGNAPQVNILSPTYSVNFGSSVTLQCTVSANPVHTTVYWRRVINGVSTDINMNTNNNKYSGSTVNSPSLVINNAATSDEGYYVCYASNSVGTGQSSQTYLDVIGNVPVVNVLQFAYSASIGGSVTLECTVTSNPAHTTVYWQKTVQGQTTDINTANTNKYSGSTVNTPSLTINNIALTDAGSYRCLADNIIGTGQSQVTIVNVAGNVPTVVLDQNAYTVNYGQSITIGCTVTSNPAHTSVYWQRISNGVTQTITVINNNKFSGSTVQSPSLTIFNADSNDEGEYICFATNSVGTGQSSRGTLDVTGNVPTVRILLNSYSVQRGNPITLECEVTGSPAHTSVYWTRTVNGQDVTLQMLGAKYGGSTVTSPSLIIFNAADNDEGSYVCHATNGIGTGHSSQTFLNVEGYVPTVVASVKPSVNVGDSVILECVITADPVETAVVWQKVINGVPTSIAIASNSRYSGGTVTTPSLTVANVEDSDEGSYICQATNSVGTGSSNQIYLDIVGEAPHLTYITPSRIVVTEGDLILATCVTTSNPGATFTWYKDSSNQVYRTGDKLEITTSSRTDRGTYTCRARNNYGTDEVSLTVEVQYKPDVTISETTSTFTGVGGNSVNIPCTHIANPAVTSVTWRKITPAGTVTLTINGNKYAGGGIFQSGLTIYDLEASDVASYQCVATNPIGTGESEIVQLTVDTQAAPYDIAINPIQVDVVVGSAFEATCTAKGDPAPTFSWYFSDQMIQTGPKLTVATAASIDDGLYTCVATNSLGIAQATMDANVRYAPISTITKSQFERELGNPVTLTCSTRANPSATEWTWTKDGTPLLNHYSDTYLVDMDSLQDLGTYTCTAKNTVGQSSIIEFNVKEKKPVDVFEVVSVSRLSAGEIAAIVVGILFAIAVTAVIIICCFTRGVCRKKERVVKEVQVQKREPSFTMVPQYKSVEYVQQEPQYMYEPRYYSQQTQYLPAIEYLSDYDDERRRRRKKKTRKPEQVVLEERVVGGGDIYSNGGSVYRTVERPVSQDYGGDVYIDTVTQ